MERTLNTIGSTSILLDERSVKTICRLEKLVFPIKIKAETYCREKLVTVLQQITPTLFSGGKRKTFIALLT